METVKASSRIHPLVATAAVAVTLASLVGIAAMTGMFPSSHSGTAPAPVAASMAPAQVASAPAEAQLAAPPAEINTKTAAPKPAPVKTRVAPPPVAVRSRRWWRRPRRSATAAAG